MSKRKPPSLDRYPPIYDEILEQVIAKGTLVLEFRSDMEAYSTRFDLYRYLNAVRHYKPDTTLATYANRVKIRVKGSKIELMDQMATHAMHVLEKGLADSKAGAQAIAIDNVSQTLGVIQSDPEYEELRKLYKEQDE